MAGYIACVFGASTELGRLVVRELLKRDEIDTVYALAVRNIESMLELSSIYMEKLVLHVKPLEKLLPLLRDFDDIDLAFCCMGSSKAAYSAMGSVEFHRLNLGYPLRFVQAMFDRDVMRIEILGHAKADPTARSDFARVKGEFEVAVRRLHRDAGPDGPAVTLFKVPLLLTNERCQDGERGLKITKNELIRQRAAVRLGAGPSTAVHVRDIAKAMRVDALLNASAVDEGTGVDILLLTKKIHFIELSGPEIVEVASKTRELEAQERAAAREHRLNDYRMADFGPATAAATATATDTDRGVPGERTARRTQQPARGRRAAPEPHDERQAYFEGADEDNPFLPEPASHIEYSNPQVQAGIDAAGVAGEALSEAERHTAAAYAARAQGRRDPGGVGSIERLKGQQRKDLLAARREDFYIPAHAGFGRRVAAAGQTRAQGAAALHAGARVAGRPTLVQRAVGPASEQSARSGSSAQLVQPFASPVQIGRRSGHASPFTPAQAQPGPRRSSMSRVQRRSTAASAAQGEGSFVGGSGSLRRSFSASYLRRNSSAYSMGRRQSFSRVGSERQAGGWLSKIADRLLSPRKESPAHGSAKRARRQNGDMRETGLIDI